VIIKKKMNSLAKLVCKFLLPVIVVSGIIASKPAVAESVAYISDKLSVPMRTGASNEHRIIKFLSSGAVMTVLEESEDGLYKQVEVRGGQSGWVLADNIMDAPGGRTLLAAASKKLSASNQRVKELAVANAELKSENTELKNDIRVLQNERTSLNDSIDVLKVAAANPMAVSKKNKQLKSELEAAHANETMLEEDNKQLRANVTQQWFIIGGGVSIGSLLLGIILTRINWSRKRDTWGDSF
jgi:SH3 domain protein